MTVRGLVREALAREEFEGRLTEALVGALEERLLNVVNNLTMDTMSGLGDVSGVAKPRWEELEPIARRAVAAALGDPRIVESVMDMAMHAMMVKFTERG